MTSPLDVLLGAQVKDGGVAVTPRRYIDFRTGLTLADDPATDSIQVSATGGGGGVLVGDVNGDADANVVTKITGDTGDVEMIAESLSWGSPGNSQLKVNAVDGAIELWNNAILALKAHATAPTIANTGSITQIIGGVRHSVRTISSNIALDSTTKDFIGWVDASAPRTITLPAPSVGRTFLLVNVGASAVTLARSGSELINGVAASYVVPVTNCIVQIVTNGTDWFALPIFDGTSGFVPSSRTISTTAPLTGGGDLSANRTLGISDATTLAVGAIKLAQDLGGTGLLPTVIGLTGTANVVALHGTAILADAGAGGRLNFSSAGVAVPAGTFSAGSNTAKVLLDSYGAFGATYSAIWLGTADPTTANVALAGNNTNTTVNANTSVQVAQGGTVSANFTSSGLRVGDATTATEKIDVVGNITASGTVVANSGGAKATLAGFPGSEGITSGIWCTSATISTTNWNFVGDTAGSYFNGPTHISFRIANSGIGRWNTDGLVIGAETTPTAGIKLDVRGEIVGTGTIRLGTNPASAGQVRVPNNTSVSARNAANSSNIVLAKTDGSNNVQLGDTTAAITEIQCGGGQSVRLSPSATAQIIATDTGSTIGVASSTNAHIINGGIGYTVKSVSANLTIDTTTTDYLVLVDSTGASRTITLPTATSGRCLIIKRKAGTNNVSIVVPGSEKIDNQSKHIDLITDGSGASISPFVALMSDGTDWFITSAWSAQVTS